MTLIQTGILNTVAVGVRILALLGINKILAIYIGPVGYATLGQFQNAVLVISTLASGAINTGVTKYTAEYYDDEARQRTLWQTATAIALIGSVILSLLVFFFRRQLAERFLGDTGLSPAFGWVAATLGLFVFNSLLLAIINGKKDIKLYVLINISGSMFALVITAFLAWKLGLIGALIAYAVYQSLTLFITIALCCKTQWFRVTNLFGRIDKNNAKNLARYSVMALTTAATIPLSHIMIRNHLALTLGWEAVGYWEAMWRLSAAYLMVITTTLSVYYLPRLSELKSSSEIRREIISGYRIILPLTMCCSFMVYLFRDFLIITLFSKDFLPMEKLFFWQLIGDILKISSWLMGFVLTAKAMMGLFVISEMFFSLLFYILVAQMTKSYGLNATSISYAIVYLLHLIFMYGALKSKKII